MADRIAQVESVLVTVGKVAGIVAKYGSAAVPVLDVIAPFVPAMAPAMAAVHIGMPYIQKIAAGAPVVVTAIEAGRPIIAAVKDHGPSLWDAVKHLYAIAVNADPNRPEVNMKAADVTDEQAAVLAGVILTPGWDNAEYLKFSERLSALGAG